MFPSEPKPRQPIWHNNVPGGYAVRDALLVLRDAAKRSAEQDMQTEDVLCALAFLTDMATRKYNFERFRQALRIMDAGSRAVAVWSAYDGIERYFTSGYASLRRMFEAEFGRNSS